MTTQRCAVPLWLLLCIEAVCLVIQRNSFFAMETPCRIYMFTLAVYGSCDSYGPAFWMFFWAKKFQEKNWVWQATTTLRKMTLSIITLGIMMLSTISMQYNNTWHNDTQDDTPHNDTQHNSNHHNGTAHLCVVLT